MAEYLGKNLGLWTTQYFHFEQGFRSQRAQNCSFKYSLLE